VKFIDIDSSFTISTETGTIKGYMVVRAPKGETEPYYFEKGNAEAIYAYIGLPTANWPDIYEAEAFNAEYGLYVSAPAGSSDSYPSYFGGAYITNKGLIDFYNVSSKDAIDYTQKVTVGTEKTAGYDSACTVTPIINKTPGYDSAYKGAAPASAGNVETLAICISSIPSSMWGSLQEVGINYWGDTRSSHTAKMYYYYINKNTNKLFVEDDDGNAIESTYCGIWGQDANNNYFIIIGGGSWLLTQTTTEGSGTVYDLLVSTKNSNNIATLNGLGLLTTISTNLSETTTAPFLTLHGLCNNIEQGASLSAADGIIGFTAAPYGWDTISTAITSSDATSSSAATAKIVGTSWVYDSVKYSVGTTITSPKSSFTWLLNIKSNCYGYFVQKSPCEKTSTITIEDIGYDKYLYDIGLPIVIGDLSKIKTSLLSKIDFNNSDKLFLNIGTATEIVADTPQALTLYQFDADSTETYADKASTNVGADNVTKELLITKEYFFTANGAKNPSDVTVTEDTLAEYSAQKTYVYKIFYVVGKASFAPETAGATNYPLHSDIGYNTMTFKVTEEVYPGQDTSGGEFTGSFNETGKDSYGANIYWPNVLNNDDFSFVEITPLKGFDDDINSDGIYTKKRIVDDILGTDFDGNSMSTSTELNLKGQRYVTSLINANISSGTLGCSWVDGFTSVVKQGWNEAYDDQYDDVYVFMDPTGQEFVHTMQMSIAASHQLAVYISPKLITKATYTTPASLTVTGRSKLCAQYAGEFQVYDSYTGKNFWCMPIGDVGYMLCRIIDKKMGGWAPAWYNYNGMGGQLGRSVLKARWNFSDSATQIMDTKGINPIVFNADDGLMIVSGKTTQDPNNLTDWSYLGHVMAFLLCKREIRDNVMRQQIEKPIDDYWIGVRETQVKAILAKRTSGANKIWAAATVDIAGVNNDTTKAMRKFCIYVKVKVNVFSETVALTFENVAQTTTLS
jgi:hypothetical protein